MHLVCQSASLSVRVLILVNILQMPRNVCILFKSAVTCSVLKVMHDVSVKVRVQGGTNITIYYGQWAEIFILH